MIIESFWIFKMFFIQYCEQFDSRQCHVVSISCDSRRISRLVSELQAKLGFIKWAFKKVYYILFYRIRCGLFQTMNNSIRYSKPAIFDILNSSLNSTRKDLISRSFRRNRGKCFERVLEMPNVWPKENHKVQNWATSEIAYYHYGP